MNTPIPTIYLIFFLLCYSNITFSQTQSAYNYVIAQNHGQALIVHYDQGVTTILEMDHPRSTGIPGYFVLHNESFLTIEVLASKDTKSPLPGDGSLRSYKKKLNKWLKSRDGAIISELDYFGKKVEYAYITTYTHESFGKITSYTILIPNFYGRTKISIIVPNTNANDSYTRQIRAIADQVQIHYHEPNIHALALNNEIKLGTNIIEYDGQNFTLENFIKENRLYGFNDFGLIWHVNQKGGNPLCYVHQYQERISELSDSGYKTLVDQWMQKAYRIPTPNYSLTMDEVFQIQEIGHSNEDYTPSTEALKRRNLLYYLTEENGYLKGFFLSCNGCNCFQIPDWFRAGFGFNKQSSR